MGFCRRCGDIVSGERCKCGGLAVRASVHFSQKESDSSQSDLWFRTYVRPTNESSPLRERSTTLPGSTPRPFADPPKRARAQSTYFPRPTLDDPALSHIDSALKHESQDSKATRTTKRDDIVVVDSPSADPDDVLPDPNASTLAKAYGSVLQPKETLSIFTCIACSNPFPPDATLYPDPSEPTTTTRFLCKPCFTINGGAKGNCSSCAKSILILTSEGGFIENAGRVWHKRCFRCDGCFKDISDKPMVDLLGRPSCEDCFDTCLRRPRTDSTASRRTSATADMEERSNLGGMMRGDKREASPAVDELHQRLGIKNRESGPIVERKGIISPGHRLSSEGIDLVQRLSDLSIKNCESSPLIECSGITSPSHRLSSEGIDLTRRLSDLSVKADPSSVTKDCTLEDTTSPRTPDASKNTEGRYARFRLFSSGTSPKALPLYSPSPRAESNPVEDTEHRSQRQSSITSSSNASLSPTTTRESFGDVLSTPDLTDSSSCATMSSPPSTPFNTGGSPERLEAPFEKTPTKPAQVDIYQTKIALSSPSTVCAKCLKPLFRTKNGGKFVTVPEESSKCLPPKSYHVECFRCAVCEEPFQETKNGQAIFVRTSTGCCHVRCATPERIIIMKSKSTPATLAWSPTKHERPPTTAPPTISSFRRFGSIVTCPGCHISVSPMEKGVVPGPQGSRWHASCLVCGGKTLQTGSRRDPNAPGCGKRLDSAAKTDGEGGVWCRACLLVLESSSKQSSPVKRLERSFTGSTGIYRFPPENGQKEEEEIAPQFTGATTIARQFTGLGALMGQFTGSGLNPTRQLPKDLNRSPSPTKGFPLSRIGEGRRSAFPRPKSVIGTRGGKSADEGRGMYLVHQFTGTRGESEL